LHFVNYNIFSSVHGRILIDVTEEKYIIFYTEEALGREDLEYIILSA
jgi:hypothetical protein